MSSILDIAMFYYPSGGGAASTTREIVTRLCRANHEVNLVAPIYKKSKTGINLYEDCLIDNLYINYIPIKRFKLIDPLISASILPIKILGMCKKIIEKNRVDIIITHFHEFHTAGVIGYLLSKKYRIPHFIRIHDIYPFKANHQESIYSMFSYLHNKKVLQDSNKIFIPNNSMADVAVYRYGLKEKQIIILPNGVDFKKINESIFSDSKSINGAVQLIFVGGLNNNRKLDILLYALYELKKEKFDIILNIIGDGPERTNIEKLINKLDLYDYINFYGSLNHESVLKIIENSHIGIGPIHKIPISEFQMPIKLIEYMAMGLPWIAMDHKGTIELSKSNSGIVLKNSSVNSIKSAIIYLITDSHKYELMSKAGRMYASKHFDWDKNIKVLLDCLDDII